MVQLLLAIYAFVGQLFPWTGAGVEIHMHVHATHSLLDEIAAPRPHLFMSIPENAEKTVHCPFNVGPII